MQAQVEFDQNDREWFHKTCTLALGPNPVADEPDDEEEEREHKPIVEQSSDPLELTLGLYPTYVKGGLGTVLMKEIMDKVCFCAQTGKRVSTCTGFCKQLDLPRVPNCKADSISPEAQHVMCSLVLATLGSHQANQPESRQMRKVDGWVCGTVLQVHDEIVRSY